MGCGTSFAAPVARTRRMEPKSGTVAPSIGTVPFPTPDMYDPGTPGSQHISAMPSFRDWRDCVSFTTFVNQTEDPQIYLYKFIKSIGRGANAEVFQVQNVETGEMFAAKIYDKLSLQRNSIGCSCTPEDRVMRELDVMRRLRHPNTMPLVDGIDDDFTNSFIFVMPFADKGSLLVQEKSTEPIPEDTARQVFAQVAEGLEYLHSLNIAHRDVKPENIMMFSDGRAVLADYSAAIWLPTESDIIEDTEGTPAFYSPEECTGDPFRAKPSDVWALGVSLYIMIFGHLPFFEITDGYFLCQLFRIAQQIQNEPLTFDPEITISDDLRDLFEKILDKNPETRLTAEQVMEHPWVKAANYVSGFDPNAVVYEEEEEVYQPM